MIFWYGNSYPQGPTIQKSKDSTQFSIIVPFRNEIKNLPLLLESISLLDYNRDNFEVILVDDSSQDQSKNYIEGFIKIHPNLQVKLLLNQRKFNSAKKDAINTAMEFAQFDWIISTDADCNLPKEFLKTYDSFIENQTTSLVAGPVENRFEKRNFLEFFQNYEFLSLQAVTSGSFGIQLPFMCNGANLCYNKSAFFEVGGFSGNEDLAGGDDLFLLEKILRKSAKQVHFLKDPGAIVQTKMSSSWKDLFSQRVRWAAKTSNYQLKRGKLIGMIVFLANLALISSFIAFLIGKFDFKLLILLFTLKLLFDGIILSTSLRFFKQQLHFPYYLFSSLLYPIFYVTVGFASFFGFTWKGRKFKK